MQKLSEASAVLFDLDGTLTDPKEGITKSVAYALGKYGVAVGDRRTLYRFIGPPLAESFERFYGFSPAQAKEAVAYYREYFQDKGIFENAVYSGVRALLAALRRAGKTLVMATSKPEVYAERIAVHFGIDRYFDCIAGSRLDGARVRKDEVIAYALDKAGLRGARGAVMVGDREHDVFGAHANGLPAAGVLYGFGGLEELAAAGADWTAESIRALRGLLLA